MTKALKLFYSYAHQDEPLLKKLNNHLASLKREGLLSEWYDRDISAGSLWAEEIDSHLKRADIILLLISPYFMASDYCHDIEMQEAMRRQEAGKARIIPIILRPCDWEHAPFKKLQALPKDAKAVTLWSNRDAAFTNVAKGIRQAIDELNGTLPAVPSEDIKRQKDRKGREAIGGRTMQDKTVTPTTLSTPVLKKAVDHYYKEIDEYKGKADYELAVRSAFQNLLAECARNKHWTLIPELTLSNGTRPDGTLRDDYFARGYWEAKGPDKDLEKEISEKIKAGYPLTNIIFENTKQAVLFQNKKRVFEYNLQNPQEVYDLLIQFFNFAEPDIASFEAAVREFKERVPELAGALLTIIEKEYRQNKKFIATFDAFTELCRQSLDPKISTDVINEMLIQHLLTERLFRTIFDNSDFINRNVIAAEIEKVIQALTIRAFNRHEFLKSLDRFYVAIEAAAKGIDGWLERQHFLDTVYERFFQGYSVKRADTYGIVYTPQEIVNFMCASVEEVLQREFRTSIEKPGVQILDPCVGTGSYIVNLLHRIPNHRLKYKYQNDLFCNEIMLLPYYIASMNIEHEYYSRMGEYEPFEGICFADTLELAENKQLPLFMVEENTDRVKREKAGQIMVVIGNPPYNVGQKSENENNKNRKYPIIDEQVYELYVKGSKATNTRALGDAYVKFFRWATDRLQDHDGIVCFVSNNSFLDSCAFDGFRKRVSEEFSAIYHLDLGGNARKRGGGNVFGVMVGIGITILVRDRRGQQPPFKPASIYYHQVPVNQSRTAKLNFLETKGSISGVEWQELHPDENYIWLTENLRPEFESSSFLPIGTKEAKVARIVEVGGVEAEALFKIYSPGVQTNRDSWMYDFDARKLAIKAERMIETYNAELARWIRADSPKDIDSFVESDESKIKWCSRLKECFARKMSAKFEAQAIRNALYRPFVRKFLYFDSMMTHRQGLFPFIFPTPNSENENAVIWLKVGSEWPMFALATNIIPDLLPQGASQCFPYYTYAEDGSNRRENITNWALKQFQAKYGSEVTKRDIFHYVYAILYHPCYFKVYEENLKCDLPRIPLVNEKDQFLTCIRIGKQLMDIHLNYEQEEEYSKLQWVESNNIPYSCRVEKMHLTPDRTAVIVNESLKLTGIPPECFQYRLGTRSALEWVIDQYQVKKDKRSGIVSDPNLLDDQEYIVHLIGKVVTVSVETVHLIKELEQAVKMEDWMSETVEIDGIMPVIASVEGE